MDSRKNTEEPEPAGEALGPLVERFIETLEGYLQNHRRLAAVMERKKEACVGVEVDDLDGIVEDERAAIDAIGASDKDRCALAGELGALLGFPAAKRPRLLDLIQLVGPEHREVLLDLRDELRDVADRIERLNRLNRTLILHSLEHVNLFLVMLRGVDPDAKIYTKGGDEGRGARPVVLDRWI